MSKSKRRDYDIGYKKPPVHSIWKKGKSGNLSGHRKAKVKLLDAEEVLDQVLSVLGPVNENDQAKKEFEAFFNEMAANLRQSTDGKKQDSDNQAEEPPEKKSDDKPPQSSERQ